MLLKLRIWLGRKLFGTVGYTDCPIGVRVSSRRMVKLYCSEQELEGLRYASSNTTLPVPELHRVHRYANRLALEMDFVTGCQTLQVCWRTLSDQQKQNIVHELGEYMRQLREVKPPNENRISSTDGGPCRDIRVASVKSFGPFEDSDAFHQCIRGGVKAEHGEKIFGAKVMQIHRQKYKVRFTHGDLSVQNILIRDGKIAAIIDWECAGWFPEYWEYTRAHYNSAYLPEFYKMLAEKVDRYDEELEAERAMWRQYDQPLDEAIYGTS